MGFDNECILNIQSLAGEYFCPVCRTLVYPNEAIQAQCTHLYCKPCLTYVVSSTQACPYDGYLVTEAASKPLVESNKALAETIGKIAVHCLYHRSGCTWQGPLSECTTHCSGCAFGNSPVVCNRCGVQIVHRQVQEHAQTCNVNLQGAHAQPQQGIESVQVAATSGAAVTLEQSKGVGQQGVQATQAQPSQNVVGAPPGQNLNQQAITNAHSQPAPTTTTVSTPEQWYQQQYQQYYQQYPGYDPYQQAYQPYYPYQPQVNPQFQQQPLHVQGPQSQPQSQLPLQHQAQIPAQLPNQPQAQPQAPAQIHTQSQVQQQIPSQGQPQANPFSQAVVLPQNQSQVQVNPQQQIHPAAQAHAQVLSQTHQLPHGLLPSQSYSQTQTHQVQNHPQQHLPVPQYQQHPQMHHAQPPSQVPPQSQSHVQAHAQPPFHPHSQLQPPSAQPHNQHPAVQPVTGQAPYPQSQAQQQMQQGPLQQQLMQIQPTSGSLPPGQLQGQLTQPPPHVRPLQSYNALPNNQPAMLPSQGQTPNIPPAQYIHPHNQQPSLPVTQRPVVHPVQQSGPQQYVQPQQAFTGQLPGPAQGQFHQPGHFAPQQAQLRPQGPHSTQQNPVGYVQQQQSVAYGVQPQQVQNYAGRPAFPNHIVQMQQFPQPSGSMGVAPQPRPSQSGPGQQSANQTSVNVKNQIQPGVLTNGALVERKSDQISDRSVDQQEPKSPSQEVSEKKVNGLAADSVEKKSETGLKSMNDEYKVGSEREENYRQDEAPLKDQVSEVYQMKNVSGDPAVAQKLKEEGKDSTLEHSPSQPLGQHKIVDERDATGDSLRQGMKSDANATVLASAEGYQGRNSSQPQTTPQGRVGDVSGGFQTKGFEQSSHSVPSDQGRPQPPPMPLGSSGHLQRPPFPPLSQPVPPSGPPSISQVPGHPPAVPRHQGHGSLPHPGQALNPQEYFQQPMLNQSSSFHPDHGFGGPAALFGRGPNHSGNHPRSFEKQLGAPQGHLNQGHIPGWHAGPSRMSQAEPVGPPMGAMPPGSFEQKDGLMGRGLPRGPEGLSGQHRPIPPIEAEVFANHRPPHFDGRLPESHVAGTMERGPVGQPFSSEPNPMRTNGAPRLDSSPAFASRDDKFKISTDERSETLPIGHTRHLDQTEVQEGVKQFPRPPHVGTEATPKFENNFVSSRPMDKGGYGMDGPSRPFDKGPHGFNFDAGQKLDAGGVLLPHHATGMHDDKRGRPDPNRTNPAFFSPGSAFGLHHMDREPPRSPGGQYLNNQPHPFQSLSGHRIDDKDGNGATFGEGYKSFEHMSESAGHSRHESRFPHLPPGNMRRGKLDGPGNYGMGENMRSGDMIGKDIPPSHLRRGEYLGPRNPSGRPHMGETGFDSFPGHGYVGESGVRPGGFPLHQPFGESFGNKPSHPRLGEPGFRSSYFIHGFPNDGRYFGGDSDSYDQLRKRKPLTMGWCRICKVDCETVEGLDMHAQSREHQKMSMDMAISIKQKNSKKQKTSSESGREEGGSNSKVMGFHGRGNKP